LELRRLLGLPPVPAHEDDAQLLRLYRTLADHVGGAVILDSSKLPPYGLLLAQQPGVELFVLHVVRDSRATAFSWQRTKATRDREGTTYMPRLQVWKSALLWLLWNLLTDHWWASGRADVVRFRYEDFVEHPRATMESVIDMLGLDRETLPFVADDAVTLAATHSVAGNPNRHNTGTVRLEADLEWRTALPRGGRLLATALTWGGLRRFHYPLRASVTAANERVPSR
jgi:hypothetical protein